MRKYIDDVAARRALETAAQHADKARDPLPFVWTGASWTTPGGEWRDLPLIRKGVGDWLADVAAGLRWYYAPAIEAEERRAELERQANMAETNALFAEAEARALLHREADSLRRDAAAITTPPTPFAMETLQSLEAVASEMLSAPDARATHLLSLLAGCGVG
ncbi:hypothetical protein ACFV3F_04065 [Streptomyces sp. NPDC059717]|uniref:hypothetical protein n=1 Tax=Streptomyces sp. NPDC059717 TaxID=3346922 RepID=UPI0036CFD97E